MKLSTAAKRPYKGGSRKLQNVCGQRTCPGNVAIIKTLYYERNKESIKKKALSRSPEDVRKYKTKWKSKNKGWVASNVASRKKHVRQATPSWLSGEQKSEIRKFYEDANRLKMETGIDHEVDHIVPIRGLVVSGLHVPWNLRVITAEENQKKNRKLMDDVECF